MISRAFQEVCGAFLGSQDRSGLFQGIPREFMRILEGSMGLQRRSRGFLWRPRCITRVIQRVSVGFV